MTDNEIIKALECCKYEYDTKCELCPYSCYTKTGCRSELRRNALELINRYKTKNEQLDNAIQLLESEIERRKNNLFCKVVIDEETMRSIIKEKVAEFELDIESIKAEAIKAFAEKLKEKAECYQSSEGYKCTVCYVGDIDNLVKEMVGDTE